MITTTTFSVEGLQDFFFIIIINVGACRGGARKKI
jgi:hypothetical protein